jgi:hypothetical protein
MRFMERHKPPLVSPGHAMALLLDGLHAAQAETRSPISGAARYHGI